MIQTRCLLPLLAAAGLSACIVAPYPYGRNAVVYESPGGPPEIVVDQAPPASYAEVVPVMPFVGALWIAGYWGWNGGRHEWVAGRWEHPRSGYAWRPHAWVQQGGRWHSREGGWVRR